MQNIRFAGLESMVNPKGIILAASETAHQIHRSRHRYARKCLRHERNTLREVLQDVAAVPGLPGCRPDVSLVHFAVLNPQMTPGNTCHLCVVTALKMLTLPHHSVHSVLPPVLWGCADCHLHAHHKLLQKQCKDLRQQHSKQPNAAKTA